MSAPPGSSSSASGSRIECPIKDTKRGSTCSAVGFLDHGLPRRSTEEPTAPTLSLGERVIWIRDTGPQFGTIRWIGRMPYICPDWTVGVEFDNPIGTGDGKFGGRRYFSTKENHAYFLPLLGLVKAEEYEESICKGVGPCLHPINIPWMSKTPKHAKPQNIGCCFSGHGNPCEGGLGNNQHCCCNVCNHTCEQCTLQCSRIAMDSVEGMKGSPFLHRAEKVGCINEASKYYPVKPCLVNGAPRTVQRRKSVTIKETSCDMSDCQHWPEGGTTLHRKWKSSDQYLVSCPQTATPFEVYIAKEVSSDTSDSDADQRGGLRSLVSCLMPGQQHKKKKQAKTSPGKGKKKLLFVPASGFIRQGIRSGSEGSIPSSSSISASSMSIQSFSGFSGNKSPEITRHSVYSCSGLDLIAPQGSTRRTSEDSTASCSHSPRDLSAIGRSGSFGTLTRKKKPPPPPPPRSSRFRQMEGSKTLGRLSSISSGSSVSESVKSEVAAQVTVTPPTRTIQPKHPDVSPSGASSPMIVRDVQVHVQVSPKNEPCTSHSVVVNSMTSSGSSSEQKKSVSSTLHLPPVQDKVVTGKPPVVSPKKPSHKKPAPQPPSNAPSPARSNQSAEGTVPSSPRKPSSLYQGTTQNSLVSLTPSSIMSSPRSPASASHNQLPSSSTSSSSVTHTKSTGSQGTLPSSSLKTEPEETIPGLVLIASQREQAIRFNSLSRSLRRVSNSDDKLSRKSRTYENESATRKEEISPSNKTISTSMIDLDKLKSEGKPELPKKTKPHDTETLFGFSLPRRKFSKKASGLSKSEEVLTRRQNSKPDLTKSSIEATTTKGVILNGKISKSNTHEKDDSSLKETITTSMEVKIGTTCGSASSRSSSQSSQLSQASLARRRNLTLPIEKKESGVQVGSSSIPTLKRKVVHTVSNSSSSSRSVIGGGSRLDQTADVADGASGSQESSSSCVVLPESSPLSPHTFSDSSSSPNQESKTSASSTPIETSEKSKYSSRLDSSSSSSSSRADDTGELMNSAMSVKDFIGSIKQLAEKPTHVMKENSLRNDRISLYMERLPQNYGSIEKPDVREQSMKSFPTKWRFSQGETVLSSSTSNGRSLSTRPVKPTCIHKEGNKAMFSSATSGLQMKQSLSLDSFAVEEGGSESSTLSRSSSTISVSSVSSCSSCRTEIPVVRPPSISYATLKRKTKNSGCRSCSAAAASSSSFLMKTDSPSAKSISPQRAINSTQGLPGSGSASSHTDASNHASSLSLKMEASSAIPSVAHLPPSGMYPARTVGHSSAESAYTSEQAQTAALLQQLELAISCGHHARASALARELAMRKVACTLSHARRNSRGQANSGIMVNLYVEDKSLHQGPIPLHVFPSMTLRMLKTKMEKEFDFSADIQRWILGKTLATDDDATLASYGITSSGCPVYLYLMSPSEVMTTVPQQSAIASPLQNRSLPFAIGSKADRTDSGKQAATPETVLTPESSVSSTPQTLKLVSKGWTCGTCGFTSTLQHTLCPVCAAPDDDIPLIDEEESVDLKHLSSQGVKEERNHKEEGDSSQPKEEEEKDYHRLVELDDMDLVANSEAFECPICFSTIQKGEGMVLRDCLHTFCRVCIIHAVQYSEAAEIKCPFRNDEYACDSQLQDREIKAVVPPELYEKYLQRSVSAAESCAEKSFHCKSPDCPGWCVYEDNVNEFPCPVCKRVNCLTCQAIHEGKNCRQYQDELDMQASNSEEARKTKEYLDNMLKVGEAMRCPQCQVIVMKKWGCDWLKCSMCQTEICWVTKGPRWGPGGRGDTSSGCKCGVKGVRCHPKCNYCH